LPLRSSSGAAAVMEMHRNFEWLSDLDAGSGLVGLVVFEGLFSSNARNCQREDTDTLYRVREKSPRSPPSPLRIVHGFSGVSGLLAPMSIITHQVDLNTRRAGYRGLRLKPSEQPEDPYYADIASRYERKSHH
jgi:hypothetical protein